MGRTKAASLLERQAGGVARRQAGGGQSVWHVLHPDHLNSAVFAAHALHGHWVGRSPGCLLKKTNRAPPRPCLHSTHQVLPERGRAVLNAHLQANAAPDPALPRSPRRTKSLQQGLHAATKMKSSSKTLPAGGQLDQPGSCGCSSSMLYSLRLAFLNFVLYASVERAMRRTAAVAPAAATPQNGRASGKQYIDTNMHLGVDSTRGNRRGGYERGCKTSGAGKTVGARGGALRRRRTESTLTACRCRSPRSRIRGCRSHGRGGGVCTCPGKGTAGHLACDRRAAIERTQRRASGPEESHTSERPAQCPCNSCIRARCLGKPAHKAGTAALDGAACHAARHAPLPLPLRTCAALAG